MSYFFNRSSEIITENKLMAANIKNNNLNKDISVGTWLLHTGGKQ